MSDLTPDQIRSVVGILWSFQSEEVRSVLTGIMRRMHDEVADALALELASGLAEPLTIGSARGFFVPPIGLRYFWSCSTSAVAVIEEPPGCRTLPFRESFVMNHSDRNWRGAQTIQFHLALPFVVFVFVQDLYQRSLQVFFRTKRWERLGDILLIPCLPNIHLGCCEACLYDFESSKRNPLMAAAEMISYFWQGTRTNELYDCYNQVASRLPTLASLDRWEQMSRHRPGFIIGKYPQLRSSCTVRSILHETQKEALALTKDWVARKCAALISNHSQEPLINQALLMLTGALMAPPPLPDQVTQAILDQIRTAE